MKRHRQTRNREKEWASERSWRDGKRERGKEGEMKRRRDEERER